MNYAEILKDSRGRAAEGLLATKIIDLMDKLRLGDTENAARRWIWELLQNAKDVSYDNKPVSVEVDYNKGHDNATLTFKHNGQPFSSDNITSLIHQVSSKKRKKVEGVKKRPTGKFGTGFLSTHLLSEKVEVYGVVKEEALPYKEFCITLDRSATDPEEVLKSVSKSLDAVSNLLNSEKEYIEFDTARYNTKFIYYLQDKKIATAQKGISDLHISLPYTLAFTDEIAQVSISHENIVYRVTQRHTLDDGIEEITITEDIGKDAVSPTRSIVVISGSRAAIALEIFRDNEQIRIKPFNELTPRLFCDFPLVGSHDFPFPVILNCPDFNINEPRNGIWLTDKDDKRVKDNEDIMDEAILLFQKLLNYAVVNNWMNLYEICKMHTATSSDWLSKPWFDEVILKSLRRTILTSPLITTSSGKKAILDDSDNPIVFFPNGVSDEIRKSIWELSKYSYTLPLFEEINEWVKVLWMPSLSITLSVLAREIENAGNLENLQTFLKQKIDPLAWLNNFYKAMSLDESFEDDVIAGKYSVLPNQSGVFLAKSDLKLDRERTIQEEIKDALYLLGTNVRGQLISEKVYTGIRVKFTLSSEQSYIDEMNLLLTGSNISPTQKYSTCDYLMSLFPSDDRENIRRNQLYDFSEIMFPTVVREKKFVSHNADIWKEADKIQIRAIVANIADKKNIEDFSAAYFFKDKTKSLTFLNNVVDFLVTNDMEGLLNLTQKPILPDQHGNFQIKDALNLDDGEIPEQLKIIAEKLRYDIKAMLLDTAIYLELPETRTMTPQAVGIEISSRIVPAAAIRPRSEETKEACRLLLLYFIEHPELASALFSDLYNHKHKLYNDEEIANNMKQAEDIKQLMNELDIISLEQLRKLISKNIPDSTGPEQEIKQITTEILASWGITTKEEYNMLMGSEVTANIFKHYSMPTTMMFDRAQELIERAKLNITTYLKESEEYNTEFIELIAPTVLAGITKGTVNVHIVFRPGDNGEVLFYYPSEKATLDLDNAELWVDDGKNKPFRLTLGRILQTTGINRIPIDGIN